MKKENNIINFIKHQVSNFGWKLFMYGNSNIQKKYWNDIEQHYHEDKNKIKVNCLHSICPNCKIEIDVIPANGTYIEKS